jgi:NTE family protein
VAAAVVGHEKRRRAIPDRPAILVLAGGGARGAFQAGAERVLREEGGYRWTRIFGVSVGALNATLLAQGEYDRLLRLWQTIREEDVHRTFSWPRVAWRVAVGGRLGFYDNRPLRDLIREHGEGRPFLVPAYAGRVSLVTGLYDTVNSSEPGFFDAVWQSATMPVIWEPVGERAYVDGAIRNAAPLGDALDQEPSEIVVVLNAPKEIEPADPPRHIIAAARRSLAEIAINEIFATDVREFLRINALVRQAAEAGVILRRPTDGSPYSFCPIRVVLPPEPLGHTLDFTPRVVARNLRAGIEAAREALRAQDPAKLLVALGSRRRRPV